MRTKTILLTAAVAAAGLAQSMAQVYSINTVGYVNVAVKGPGFFTLVSNPLDNGSNTVSSLVDALPNKSSVQIWNGSGYNLASKASGVWTPNTVIPVGTGFFVKNAGATLTNTFVGTVVPNPGGTNVSGTIHIPATTWTAGLFSMRGSVLPVAGALNDAGGAGTLNLGSTLPNKSSIQTWDNSAATPAGSLFVLASKAGGVWSPNPTLNVGQGFFVKPAAGSTNWTQVYP